MPPVNKIGDQTTLVPTSQYPSFAKFPFDNFNPVQSRIMEIYDKDCSAVIAAQTSAGKTVCAEMFMAHEVRKRGGKAMYLAPLRALAKEKIDDWTADTHHFHDLGLSICTGDYRLTPARKKELEDSRIILMTSEMLNTRCRNIKSESNDWLKDVGTLVIDESHLLTVPGRGDHLEVGLMKFSEISKNCRLVLLSATMPNVNQIADWVSYELTGRETYLLQSEYRPCPLGIHWDTYWNQGYYEEQEGEKVQAALEIVDKNPDDRHLIFTHTKKTGELMKKQLIIAGYECEFHNADLEKEKRQDLEKRFRTGKLQIVIATSTLAWGLNLPARRVIILGLHRGMQVVDTWDIWQMAGRAGRPGYDPRGDVYILCPESSMMEHQLRLKQPQPIESRLLDNVGGHYKTLAFHLVSEIHHGYVKTKEDVHNWYRKSLAHFQTKDLHDNIIDATVDLLVKCGAIKEENGIYKVTKVGTISSMFYYSPFDIADLKRNFGAVFGKNMESNDHLVSMALGNVDSIRMGIVSKSDREEMGTYAGKIRMMFKDSDAEIKETAIKGGFIYHTLMNGLNPGAMAGVVRNSQFDFPRLATVLAALDSMACKWGKSDFIDTLKMRVAYGAKAEYVDLCRLPDIGKVRAERLYVSGIKSVKDVAAAGKDRLSKLLGLKSDKIDSILEEANKLKLGL
jgi:replicative superfamily II helicase